VSEETAGKLTPVCNEDVLHSIHSWSLQQELYLHLPFCSKCLDPQALKLALGEGKDEGQQTPAGQTPPFISVCFTAQSLREK